MYSGVTAVLLLTSVGYICGGSQVPITSYVCTEPNTGNVDQCNVSNGLRECPLTSGTSPLLLDGSSGVPYIWNTNPNPFVVLDIPQGWCVGSVQMEFITASLHPTPSISISVHNMSQLSNNSHDVQAMHSGGIGVSDQTTGNTSVVLTLTPLTCGRYLRIDMSSTGFVVLTEIAVLDTNKIASTPPSSASPRKTTPPSSASDTPTSSLSSMRITPTNSAPFGTDMFMASSQILNSPPPAAAAAAVPDFVLPAAISGAAVLLLLVLIVIFVIVICIIARRHNSRKSLMIHHLSLRRQSSDTFKDDQQYVVVRQENTQVAIHDASSAVNETNNNREIGDAVYTYATVGPSEFKDHFGQDAVEEPVAECDHLYSAVDKSRKMSATAGMPPSAGMVHSTDGTHVYDEVDKWSKEDEKSDNVCGGSENVEGDFTVELQNITSADTDRGAVPTEAVVMDTMYAQVDYSKKKSKKT